MIKTGFTFIDKGLGGLHPGDLATVQGECMQAEQFVISLTQSIVESNDGFVLLLNTLNFPSLVSTIFDENPANYDYALINDRISKNKFLTRHGLLIQDVELFVNSLSAWLYLKKFRHLKDKKLLAIVVPIFKLRFGLDEDKATLLLKDAAQILDVPVICWQRDSSKDLVAADIIFKLTAERGCEEPVDIEVIKQPGNKIFRIRANESALKYTEHLKNCSKLWFYEEKMKLKSILGNIFYKKKHSKKLVINTEVTGLDIKNGHKLVEIAAIEIDEDDIQTGAVFHAYINPQRSVPKEIAAIHGLDNDFLNDYPTFTAYKDEFLRFIEGKEIIGHNVQFDLEFLNNEIGFKLSNKVTDTLEMARKIFPDKRNNLSALKERLNIEIKNPAYNGALLDALYAYEIYKRLKNS